MIPEDIEKWFMDPDYGKEIQDMDFALAEPTFVPRLEGFLAESQVLSEKRVTVITALLLLLSDIKREDCSQEWASLSDRIKATIRKYPELVEIAIPELSLLHSVIAKRLLNQPLSELTPPEIIDEADRLIQ
jgi:hypothetical protein